MHRTLFVLLWSINMISEKDKTDKKENIYSIMNGNQIVLCKKLSEIERPQSSWIFHELSASSMPLSHSKWLPFLMQRPYDHKVTFRLSKEGTELKEKMLKECEYSLSNRVEKMDCFCLVKDMHIWNDPVLWDELYKANEFYLWDTFPFNIQEKYERYKELLDLRKDISHICNHLENMKLSSWDEKVIDEVGNGNIEEYVTYLIDFYSEHGAGPEKKFFNHEYRQDITKIPICYLRFFRVKSNSSSNGKDVVKNFDERFNRINVLIENSWKRLDSHIRDIQTKYKIRQPKIISDKLTDKELYVNYKDIRQFIK